MRAIISSISLACCFVVSGCQRDDFVVIEPSCTDLVEEIHKGPSENSQLLLDRDVLWQWQEVRGGIEFGFSIHDRPLSPNITVWVNGEDERLHLVQSYESHCQWLACAPAGPDRLSCGFYSIPKAPEGDLCLIVEDLETGSHSELVFRLRLVKAGKMIVFM